MTSIRHMDPSMDTQLRRETHQIAILCISKFCRAARDPGVFDRMREAFLYTLRDFVDYALLGEPKHASAKLDETEELIDRAKRMSRRI